MRYLPLTKTKYQEILSCLDEDKNDAICYYPRLYIKEHRLYPPKRDCKIAKFSCLKDYIFPGSKKIKIIFQGNKRILYKMVIVKLRYYTTNKTLKKLDQRNKLCKALHDALQTYGVSKGDEFVCYHITGKMEKLDQNQRKRLFMKKMHERINPDVCFGVCNIPEIEKIYERKLWECITLNKQYENLDFYGLFDEKKNFKYRLDGALVSIEYAPGKFFEKETTRMENVSKVCYDFLYKPYLGSKKSWYGYTKYTFDNYDLVVKKDEKYYHVFYSVDNASCAGFIFTLYVRIYDNMKDLLENMPEKNKISFLQKNLPHARNNTLSKEKFSESDYSDFTDSD